MLKLKFHQFSYVGLVGFFFVFHISLRVMLPGSVNSKEFPIFQSMKSEYFKYFLVVEGSCSLLMIIEMMIDSYFYKNSSLLTRIDFFNLLMLSISSMIILFVAIPASDYLLVFFFQQSRLVTFVSATLLYTYYYGNYIWKSPLLICSFIVGMVGFLLKAYDTYRSGYLFGQLQILAPIIQGTSSVVILLTLVRWMNFLYIQSKSRSITKEEWNCTMYASLCTLLIVVISVVFMTTGINSPKDYSAQVLCIFEGSALSFSVVVGLYQSRSSRLEHRKREEELEFKRMFVRYISHEVRTPLNTAIMGLQVLLEDMRTQSKQDGDNNNNSDKNNDIDTVVDIKNACDVAVSILSEILAFDKLESGTLTLDKDDLFALQLIRETVNSFNIQARQAQVSLRLTETTQQQNRTQLSNLKIFVDRHKVAQIIRNLISNAIKFTPSGGTVEVIVDIISKTRASELKRSVTQLTKHPLQVQQSYEDITDSAVKYLKISVKDSGAGISVANQRRLFKEIVQFQPGKLQNGGGSGLGLYISYGIAKLHEGDLTVFSRGEGQGSTFTFILPISPANNHSVRHSSQPLKAINSFYRSVRQSISATSTRIFHASRDSGRSHTHAIQQPRRPDYQQRRSAELSVESKEDTLSGQRKGVAGNSHNTGHKGGMVLTVSVREGNSGGRKGEGEGEGNVNRNSEVDLQVSMRTGYKPEERNNSPTANYTLKSPALTQIYISPNGENSHFNIFRRSSCSSTDSKDVHPVDEISRRRNTPNPPSLPLSPLPSSAPPSPGKYFDLVLLVVDDSDISRKMQLRLLKKRFRTCFEAENGLEAVKIIESMMIKETKQRNENEEREDDDDQGVAEISSYSKSCGADVNDVKYDYSRSNNPRIDVVLMDSEMPVMNGLEASKRIRGLGYKGLIVGLTGNVSTDEITEYCENGADHVIGKPLNIVELETVLSGLLLIMK